MQTNRTHSFIWPLLIGGVIFFLLVHPLWAAGPVITNGYVPHDEDLIGTRFRSFRENGAHELYIGVPDLGNGGNRNAAQLSWQSGLNEFVYELDRTADKMTTTVTNTNGSWTLVYDNLAAALVNKGKTHTLDQLNVLVVTVADRDNNSTADLLDLHVNGEEMGDFGVGQTGYHDWTITDLDLSDGFIITGTIYLDGPFSNSQEKSRVELRVGVDAVVEKCGLQAEQSYEFYTPDLITVTIPAAGLGDLNCLSVQEQPMGHPDSDGQILPHRYWVLTATNAAGEPATGFNLALDIPLSSSELPEPGESNGICHFAAGLWQCDGQTANGQVSRQQITADGEFAIGQISCQTPSQPPMLAIAAVGQDILLSWPENNRPHRVWITQEPYFDPTMPGNQTAQLVRNSRSYTQTAVVSQVNSFYYVAQTVGTCGTPSAPSATVGKFTFAITPGN